jgi:hypothetical protein
VKYKHIYLTLPYLTLLYLFFGTKPTDQTTEPICTHDASNDADCSKEVPFGGLIDEKNFAGKYPFPKIFKGHFTCKSKKSNNFRQVKENRKIPKQTYTMSGSRNRTVTTSGLARPIAAEIVFLPFSAIKALITSKRYKMDDKCLRNTNRKPCSLYRLVTSLPVSKAP